MQHRVQHHVCLVTPGHLSTNPRLVKEADALIEAGYRVTVVAARFLPWADRADAEFHGRAWTLVQVRFGPLATRLTRLKQKLRQKACRLLYRLAGWCAADAKHPATAALRAAAARISADLYIAHNLPALPAAHAAARRHRSPMAFDAEDFHRGELSPTPENAFDRALNRSIEDRFIPSCSYVSAASPLIAQAYRRIYATLNPVPVLNAFPRSHAPDGWTARGSIQPGPSIYWFSQTIGEHRGIETIIDALVLCRTRPTLFLQGNANARAVESFSRRATLGGVADRLTILPPAAPSTLVRLAARYDLGMASEVIDCENHGLCLSNKIFTYLLAGVPVLATDTPAQRELADAYPEVIQLYPIGDAGALAARIDAVLGEPERLASLREQAWTIGQHRLNWDVEKHAFLARVAEQVKTAPEAP